MHMHVQVFKADELKDLNFTLAGSEMFKRHLHEHEHQEDIKKNLAGYHSCGF